MGLKKDISIQTRVDQYKMEWNAPTVKGKVLILVEGKQDRLFYFKFFDHDKVEIRKNDGSQGILDLLNQIESQTTITAIVIKDSDFGRLNANLSSKDNVFYADGHDYEMMCFRNNDVRTNLMLNLGMIYDESVYLKTFDDLRTISYIQWYNYTNRCGYAIKAFPVGDMEQIELQDFDVIYNKIIERTKVTKKKDALRLGKNPDLISVPTLEKCDFDSYCDSHKDADVYEMTSGHMFILRMQVNLKEYDVNYKICSEEDFKRTLHPCFGMSEFAKTSLYSFIRKWQETQKIKILAV